MSLVITETTSKSRTPMEAGSYAGVLTKIIDIGFQERKSYDGQDTKISPQVIFFWEFPFEDPIKIGEDSVNRSLLQFLTMSGHAKSNMRKTVEALRGPMTDDEIKNFDLRTLLGKPASVEVTLKNERNYVKAVAPLLRGMAAPVSESELLWYDITEDQSKGFVQMAEQPEFIQKMITQSKEYKAWYERSNRPAGWGDEDAVF